jgi:hypothetical protein
MGLYMPIADVIKYEGDNAALVWKHPAEDFNTTSQFIVHESQEAIFLPQRAGGRRQLLSQVRREGEGVRRYAENVQK